MALKNSEVEFKAGKAVDCLMQERIDALCSCPKTDCPRHGRCCECIQSHKNRENVKMIIRFPHCLRELVKETVKSGLEG